MKTKVPLNRAMIEKRSSPVEKEKRKFVETPQQDSQFIPAFDYSGILTVLLRR